MHPLYTFFRGLATIHTVSFVDVEEAYFQKLSHYICCLFFHFNPLDSYSFINILSEMVVFHCYVLSSWTKLAFFCHCNATLIVFLYPAMYHWFRHI